MVTALLKSSWLAYTLFVAATVAEQFINVHSVEAYISAALAGALVGVTIVYWITTAPDD